MASYFPDEGRSADEGGGQYNGLPSRTGGAGREGASRPAQAEARAELRDRETYYAELRLAVHCQSRSVPVPRAPLDDARGRTVGPRGAEGDRPGGAGASGTSDGVESWDEMIAHFGDTWT